MQYIKSKSASKLVVTRGETLKKRVLHTVKTIADIVGGTLGPGGHPVLIERQEFDLPPVVTKDGVTVFRALGFPDALDQCLLEATRDVSVRTADEAGDGTTTASILLEALTRLTYEYCDANPHVSPQVVTRRLMEVHRDLLAPAIAKMSRPASLTSNKGRRLLRGVATISANGDVALADAVMQCYDICGDDGNVTITDDSGPEAYRVDKIDGYPLPIGYEDSIQRLASLFVNNLETQQIELEKPAVILYFGRITDPGIVLPLLRRLAEAHQGEYLRTPNVLLVATGFAENVLGLLAQTWQNPVDPNVLPVLLPFSPFTNGARLVMEDLAAVTGATILDPVTNRLEDAMFEQLGNLGVDSSGGDDVWVPLGLRKVEMGRYRTTLVGHADEGLLLDRADEVRAEAEQAASALEKDYAKERLAKLTSGVARLCVVGGSNAAIKERRDRAEDAICAVRGAIKHGVLPGGTWTLAKLQHLLQAKISIVDEVVHKILIPALMAPWFRLTANVGLPSDQASELWVEVFGGDENVRKTWNAGTGAIVDAYATGLLDATPAVAYALANAVAGASTMGTLGGAVIFPRDIAAERSDARDAADFVRALTTDPNER